ncbi:MAG: hypothetical protein J6V99_07385 [Neisseriaceae bacterium]|nr:hypothetical protein [Neisseriaceae bacterium]
MQSTSRVGAFPMQGQHFPCGGIPMQGQHFPCGGTSHAGATFPVRGHSHAGAALPVQGALPVLGLKQTALNLGRFLVF